MRAHEFITSYLFEEKIRKDIGNSITGLIKLEYDYDLSSKRYSGKFSLTYINLTISSFYNLKNGRILGIDNMNHHGKIEVHWHLHDKYLSVPSLNGLTYPQIVDKFYYFVKVITEKYIQDKNAKTNSERF